MYWILIFIFWMIAISFVLFIVLIFYLLNKYKIKQIQNDMQVLSDRLKIAEERNRHRFYQ